MEASSGPSPSGAGTSGSQSSPNSSSNSAAADSNVTSRPGGAPASSDSSTPKARDASPRTEQKSKPATDDGPEWEFSNGKKYKRSEVEKRLSEVQSGAQKAWKERQEYEAKLKAREARWQKLGIDPEAFDDDAAFETAFSTAAQKRLAKQLEDATLPEEERERRELAQRAEQAEARLKELDEARAKEEHTKQVDTHADQIAGHFATALQEHGLPANPKSVWLMASLLQGARKSGEQISIGELARRTSELIDGDLNHYLPDEDGAGLAKRLGQKRVEALRKHLLNEHQSKFQSQTPKRAAEPKVLTNPKQRNGYITFDEMLAQQKRR